MGGNKVARFERRGELDMSVHNMSARRFSIGAMRHDDRYTLLFRGELDMASASSVEELTRELCVDGANEIVLDLSGLGFGWRSSFGCRLGLGHSLNVAGDTSSTDVASVWFPA